MRRKKAMLKAKRNAVILSMLSLLLSVSMLLGTTYAWFTEEITSGVNQIIAGNLDIKLEHKNLSAATGNFTEVTSTTDNLFSGQNGSLAPGKATAETFKVTNNGSLALKYQLFLTGTQTGAQNLTDIILIAFTTDEVTTEAAENTSDLTFIPWTTAALYTSYLKPAGENAHNTETFTIVLKINENAANINTYQNVQSQIGVKLVATQLADETDSFDALYDSGAYAGWQNAQFAENGAAAIVGKTATIDSDTIITFAENTSGSVSFTAHGIETAKDNITANKNGVVASFDITSTVSDFATATVTTKIAKGLTENSVSVKYDGTGTAPENVHYTPSDGTLTFTTTHFSTFYVTTTDVAYYNNQGYASLDAAMNAANESTTTENPVITLLGGCTLDTEDITAELSFSTNTTLNMNGCTISVNNVTPAVGETPGSINNATLNITGENLAIENGTFELKKSETNETLTINVTGAGMTFGGVTVNGNIATAAKDDLAEGEQQTSLTLVNCTVNGRLTEAVSTEIVVNSAVFDRDPSSFISSGKYDISHEDSTTKWTVEKKSAQSPAE